MKTIFVFTLLFAITFPSNAQVNITRSVKDFGAKGNGTTDDHDAFVKAAAFFKNRKGHGKLIIPKGTYIVGRQKFAGDDKKSFAYVGEYVLDLSDCQDLIIEGKPGAILKHRDGLRIGTFSPDDGKPFKHSIKNIQVKPEYARYASHPGCMIFVSHSSNIHITGLMLQGNMANLNFGGNWGIGRNPFELIHYGIYILDAHDIYLENCQVKDFACDGMYVANLGQELKTYKIVVNKCRVNFCGRNGLSWVGGENIKVTNSEFSNAGRGIVHESPGAGIDVEVENSSFCRNGYFYNCTMENNGGSAITSGSKDLSSNVLFKKCTAASPDYYTVFADAPSHSFEDCKFYGTVLVWYMANTQKEAAKFKRCLFDENYKGKKMYNGNYQLGTEAAGVIIDSCTFKGYTTSSYYMAGHAKDCNPGNAQLQHVSNCIFYNYCETGFKLSEKVAGIASHTIFYNNKFYAKPGVKFLNGFDANCHADAGKNEFSILK